MNKKTKDTLLLFDNIECLTNQRQFDRFSMTLRKLLQKAPSIKAIVVSVKPVTFLNIEANKQYRQQLEPLDPIRSADLLLSATFTARGRPLLKNEVDMDASVQNMKAINEILWDAPNIEKCKGIPQYLCEFSNHLISHDFNEIEVTVNPQREDRLDGTPGHHKQKSLQPRKLVSFKIIDPSKSQNATIDHIPIDAEISDRPKKAILKSKSYKT